MTAKILRAGHYFLAVVVTEDIIGTFPSFAAFPDATPRGVAFVGGA